MIFQARVSRLEPPQVADEREALEGWLDYFRSQTLLAMDQLTTEELRRRVPADDGTSLLGVVRHLMELERTWLVDRWGGRGPAGPDAPSYVDDPDARVRASDLEEPETLVQSYQWVCELGRDALAGSESLDDAVRDDRRGHIELRWILLHLITETARYAGAAQVVREVILADRAPRVSAQSAATVPVVPPPPGL